MNICEEQKYVCSGQTRPAISSSSSTTKFSVDETRTITLTVGTRSLDLQKRARNLKYSDSRKMTRNGSFWIETLNLFETEYSPCWSSGSVDDTSKFDDLYETVDTELAYLDLRNDIMVTKEVSNTVTVTGDSSKAPSKTISVFTGYDAVSFFSYVFDSVPIKEKIMYKLYTSSEATTLHTEEVGRGYPWLALLMPTFPFSAFGIRIDTEWAKDIEWYRQDIRKTGDLDGDAYLFYPEYLQSSGKLAQSIDQMNRQIIYDLDKSEIPSPTIRKTGLPEIAAAKIFRGSIAFDVNSNMFYSIAVQKMDYQESAGYILTNKLVADGVLPTEKVYEKTKDGELIETTSGHTCYYPISPI